MDLKTYFALLWRRKWLIVLTPIFALLAAGIAIRLMTPIYSATASLRVATIGSGSLNDLRYGDTTYGDRLMNTYIKMATSGPLLAEVTQKLGRRTPPQVSADAIANTEFLRITVEDPSPGAAAEAANTLAALLVTRVYSESTATGQPAQDMLNTQILQAQNDLTQAQNQYENLSAQPMPNSIQLNGAERTLNLKEQIYSDLLTQYEQTQVANAVRASSVTLFEAAVPPTAPVKPAQPLILGLALLAGLFVGTGLAFLFENLAPVLYTAEQIEEVTELPAVGKIPLVRGHQEEYLFAESGPDTEAFGRLRAALLAPGRETPLRKLLVTSAEPGEGKSTVVANLARAIAASGRTVVVVDCDLRLPVMHTAFGVANEIGLSSVLAQEVRLEAAVQDSQFEHLRVLPSGPRVPNPAELLGSQQMISVITQLGRQYDTVLLDAPSLLAVADATALAPAADGVFLVVGRAQAHREATQQASRQLRAWGTRIVGVVVNRAEASGRYRYYADRRRHLSDG